jgi:rhodanese-related sulfurtransferase
VREPGQFGEGHPLFAIPCPYSTLEFRIGALVPRRSVPVLLIDDGDGIAEKAARQLAGLGFTDLSIVEGGAPGWAAAGYTLFKGVNVPSKTLGELYEHAAHVPTITAHTLAEWRAQDAPFRLFDARPPSEYARMRVPGAACLPNGELAHRFATVIDDPRTPVLVTCAGRTRGIVGVAGLRLAGVPNPVYALENGTQGWALAGETLERGNRADPFPPINEAARAASRDRGMAVADRWQIPVIGPSGLARLAGDRGRTLYLFDVRSAAEFAAGHPAAAVHAPAGQLAQATDQWIGVRRSRVVLMDDTGLRAALTAFWLRQLGYEVFVLTDIESPERRAAVDGIVAAPAMPAAPGPSRISPADAQVHAARGEAAILDLRGSRAFNAERVAGSLWSVRPRLAATLANRSGGVILLADAEEVAVLAAIDLHEAGFRDIVLIDGGFAAWRNAGLPVESGGTPVRDAEAIDYLFFVHDRHDGNLESSRHYLAWETRR